jgi:hypothetical protein
VTETLNLVNRNRSTTFNKLDCFVRTNVYSDYLNSEKSLQYVAGNLESYLPLKLGEPVCF